MGVGADMAVVTLDMVLLGKKKNRERINSTKKYNLISGAVEHHRSISKHKVQIQFKDIPRVIELEVGEPWVISDGNIVVVSGEENKTNGKYMAYAYKNLSNGVIGHYHASWILGTVFVVAGIGLFYAIIPILHLISGLKMLNMGIKSQRAYLAVRDFSI